jgi:hypothetical protein
VYQPVTSATIWVVPAWLKKDTLPPAPTGTTTRLASVAPGAKFSDEVAGRGLPVG